jgi:hypothetical protein
MNQLYIMPRRKLSTYPLSSPQNILLSVGKTYQNTIDQFKSENIPLTDLHLNIILVAKELLSKGYWFSKGDISISLYDRGIPVRSTSYLYKRINELVWWDFFNPVGKRSMFTSQKYTGTNKMDLALRRLSLHLNRAIDEKTY